MVGLGAFVLSFTVATAVVQTSAGATLDGSSSVGSETIVARAGDTLWTIARRIDPVGDIDPLVAELVRLNGASIAAGQTVRLP